MGEKTGIVWTEHTFSPWMGCSPQSPGCDNCYGEAWAKRFGLVVWGGPRRLTSNTTWRKVLRWYESAKERGVRERIFPSLCDPFDVEVPAEWRERFYGLIRGTHEHFDWMLLTKRAEELKHLPADVAAVACLGMTVENQAMADARLEHLFVTQARMRFISIEPLLGPVNLGLIGTVPRTIRERYTLVHELIGWVIVGGESGPNARPLNLDWVRALRDECAEAKVPFMFKQDSGLHPEKLPLLDGVRHEAQPEPLAYGG